MRSPAIFLATFSLGLFGLASAQGTLWVVDDDGGVGVDFLDVQPAVDAAGSGDTIEVRSGTYGDVSIVGKGLRVFGEGAGAGTAPLLKSIRVDAIGASESVVLRGLDANLRGLLASNSQGAILVEDCSLLALGLLFTLTTYSVRVENCLGVAFVRCDMLGFAPLVGPLPHLPAGLETLDSYVHLFDCTVLGADGRSTEGALMSCSEGCWGPGNPAIRQSGGLLYLSGSAVRGGDEGVGFCFMCSAQPGGPGLVIEGSSPLTFRLGTAIQAGLGSVPMPAVQGPVDQLAEFPGSPRSFQWEAWVAPFDTLNMTYLGQPNDAAFLAVSLAPVPYFLPVCHGTVWFDPAMQFLPAGTVPAGGILRIGAPAPALAPFFDAVTIFGQGIFFDSQGQCYLGSPSALTLHH